MADTNTQRYGFVKPDNSASNDTWGVKTNSNWDSIDSILYQLRTDLTAAQTAVASNAAAINANKAAYDTYVSKNTYPAGAISVWRGTAATIPDGWVICDGKNGTPDLRDKFLVGAGLAYAPLDAGGAASRTPTVTVGGTAITIAQMPSHNHGYSDPGHAHSVYDPGHTHSYVRSNIGNGGGFSSGGGGNQGGYADGTGGAGTGMGIYGAAIGITISNNGGGATHDHTATSSAIDIRPPYLALCFIMKV